MDVPGMCTVCASYVPNTQLCAKHRDPSEGRNGAGTYRCAEYVLDAVIRTMCPLCAVTPRLNFGTGLAHTPAKLETAILYIYIYYISVV